MSKRTSPLADGETYMSVTRRLADLPMTFPMRKGWWAAMAVSLLLFLLMILAIAYPVVHGVGLWGVNIPVNWGIAISNYVFWIGIGNAGTFISAMLLLVRQDWRNSLNRLAEAMTIIAALCASIFPIVHLGRQWNFYWNMVYPSTFNVWPQFRSPLEWDVFALSTYIPVSVLFWYVGLLPDLASARDRATNRGWQVFFGVLALGWRGSAIHWARWRRTYLFLAALAMPLVVSVHSGVALLFAVGQIPGWHTTVFPPYFVLGALFSGFAVVAMITPVMRKVFSFEALITERHLDMLGKFVLITGLMTSYGYAVEVFSAWYSQDPHILTTLADRLAGADAWSYWGAVIFNFGPLQTLWWRRVRCSPTGLFLVGLAGTIGMWLERYMLVMTSLQKDFLPSSWDGYLATFWDWALTAGSVGLFMVLFLLFVRLLPVISISELKEILHARGGQREAGHGE